MPAGDPAGYLPNVLKSRKRKGQPAYQPRKGGGSFREIGQMRTNKNQGSPRKGLPFTTANINGKIVHQYEGRPDVVVRGRKPAGSGFRSRAMGKFSPGSVPRKFSSDAQSRDRLAALNDRQKAAEQANNVKLRPQNKASLASYNPDRGRAGKTYRRKNLYLPLPNGNLVGGRNRKRTV